MPRTYRGLICYRDTLTVNTCFSSADGRAGPVDPGSLLMPFFY